MPEKPQIHSCITQFFKNKKMICSTTEKIKLLILLKSFTYQNSRIFERPKSVCTISVCTIWVCVTIRAFSKKHLAFSCKNLILGKSCLQFFPNVELIFCITLCKMNQIWQNCIMIDTFFEFREKILNRV